VFLLKNLKFPYINLVCRLTF